MTNLEALGITEGFIDEDNVEKQIEAWQYLIDSGLASQLQGDFWKFAAALIEEGVCTAPNTTEEGNDEHN